MADVLAWPFWPGTAPAAGGDGPDEAYLGDLVMVARGLMPTEAHLLCEGLRGAGLAAEVADAHLVQTHSLLAIAVGGAGVRVPQSQAEEARSVIAALRRGDFALGDDFDPGVA